MRRAHPRLVVGGATIETQPAFALTLSGVRADASPIDPLILPLASGESGRTFSNL